MILYVVVICWVGGIAALFGDIRVAAVGALTFAAALAHVWFAHATKPTGVAALIEERHGPSGWRIAVLLSSVITILVAIVSPLIAGWWFGRVG